MSSSVPEEVNDYEDLNGERASAHRATVCSPVGGLIPRQTVSCGISFQCHFECLEDSFLFKQILNQCEL